MICCGSLNFGFTYKLSYNIPYNIFFSTKHITTSVRNLSFVFEKIRKSWKRHWLNSQYSAINMKRRLLIILFTPSILSRLSHKKQLATTRFNKMWTRNHQTNTKIRVGYIPLIYTDFTTPLDYAFQQQDTLRGNTEDNTEDPTQTDPGKIRREALHTPPKRG